MAGRYKQPVQYGRESAYKSWAPGDHSSICEIHQIYEEQNELSARPERSQQLEIPPSLNSKQAASISCSASILLGAKISTPARISQSAWFSISARISQSAWFSLSTRISQSAWFPLSARISQSPWFTGRKYLYIFQHFILAFFIKHAPIFCWRNYVRPLGLSLFSAVMIISCVLWLLLILSFRFRPLVYPMIVTYAKKGCVQPHLFRFIPAFGRGERRKRVRLLALGGERMLCCWGFSK